LRERSGATTELLEVVLAMDWCWNDLDPAARREFLFGLRPRAEPLNAADSPLQPRRFREKLAALALALAVDQIDEPSPSWVATRQRLLDGARTYFVSTFPNYVAWRGLSPTGPAAGPQEECDTALAIELARQLLGRDLWPDYQGTVGRWLEHYILATIDHPALAHGFIRDDGGSAPLLPAPVWRDLLPLTAHLIASRTRDPSAALVADRVESAVREAGPNDLAGLWRWVPIALDTTGIPRCDPGRLPAARNLGGSVVFRGGSGPQTTAIWIDAGQPFLRRRQHFDAGSFLICRGGELTVDGGDDVVFEAVPSKGGSQHLAQEREPFDFEQYFTASIAHNCLVVWDAARIGYWYKQRYLPIGGQRCIEDTCSDFVTPLDAQGRRTGRQLAYGQHADAAYLALDLAPAYESRVLAAYTREFVFLWGRALVIIDRVTLPKGRPVPTWVLNLPARPQVEGSDLAESARVAGSSNEAGIWRCDTADWLRWTDRDGCLWLTALLPAPKCLRVVGGPARKLVVQEGRQAERTYVGGDADGFERLIIPAERHGSRNAWYRLGRPDLLGSEFGKTPHWGRIEIEPAESTRVVTFANVLVTDRADASQAPSTMLEPDQNGLVLRIKSGPQQATLRLPAEGQGGGALEVEGAESFSWTLPTEVLADPPLATD
jgi:hypothetical protein